MKDYLPILHLSPFFQEMNDEEILSIIQCVEGHIIQKKENETILHAGNQTNEMGIVLAGSVLLEQIDIWGHRNMMHHCFPGESFGEPYAVNQLVLNVSATASKDSTILMLNISKILGSCQSICSHHNKLIRNLVSVLSFKIMNLNNKITHMSKRTTREKILSYLSDMALKKNSLSFDIPFDRQQLADYLCVERAAMSTEINKLVREGYIKTNRKHFDIIKS